MSETIAVEEPIECVTHESSRCSSRYGSKTTTITIRVPLWLFQKLREKGITNLSRFVRQLLISELDTEFSREQQLEFELERLKEEMEKLHEYHITLLKHGSYAKDYFRKLKEGITVTHNPFHYSKGETPTLSQEELQLVDEIVRLRGELAKKYEVKLRELMELKRNKLGLR